MRSQVGYLSSSGFFSRNNPKDPQDFTGGGKNFSDSSWPHSVKKKKIVLYEDFFILNLKEIVGFFCQDHDLRIAQDCRVPVGLEKLGVQTNKQAGYY